MLISRATQSRRFEKQYALLPMAIREKFIERFLMFKQNPTNPLLNKHLLHGEYSDCYSINVTGNYRAIFRYLSPVDVEFIRIGTHSQLYKN